MSAHWLDAAANPVADLERLLRTPVRAADYPLAATLEQGVPVYDCAALRQGWRDASTESQLKVQQRGLMSEWISVWLDGPGLVVLKGALDDLAVVDAVTLQFRAMIDEAHRTGPGGDHFGQPGQNDRVWDALGKLCLRAPQTFAAYYGNEMIALACEAWLGPAYQVTSQVNCVNPGGPAQTAHRDYHLGFYTGEQATRFPAHVHRLSPVLTLQGAVAHVDMPLESGPTLYLPHSQKYPAGYVVAGQSDFQAFFDAHHVQLPLARGDAIFFNPALLHAAGYNRTPDIRRMANLLQVSSAFGRCMESVDRVAMSSALYPALLGLQASGAMSPQQVHCAVAACAEGYAFPTNLDRDPPLGGIAPPSQQDLMRTALREGWAPARFDEALMAQARNKQP